MVRRFERIGGQMMTSRKTIGQELEGLVLASFKLKERRLFLEFEGGVHFEVHAQDYKPLKLRLITPNGVTEE